MRHGFPVREFIQGTIFVQLVDEVEVRPHGVACVAVIVEDVVSYMIHASHEIGVCFSGVADLEGNIVTKPAHEFLGVLVV